MGNIWSQQGGIVRSLFTWPFNWPNWHFGPWVLLILSALYWCYEMDGGTWMYRHCDQSFHVIFLPGMPTWWPPWECPACHGIFLLKHNSWLIFDPTYPDIDQTAFPSFEWTELYGSVEEAIPPNMPPPLGKDIDLCMMVDSDHAEEKRTRRSQTGFIIFCNLAPIIQLSKQQATIVTSVFGAEFVAMKHRIEMLRGLRYKIPMMGIPLSGPHTSMVTISPKWPTHLDLNRP